MDNTKEKVSKLSSEDEKEISGGYTLSAHSRHSGSLYVSGLNYCDNCNCSVADKTVIPFQGGHLCLDCLKELEEQLGRKLL